MKILIFGDVYGRIGRKALKKELPGLKQKYNPDFVVVNVDNLSSGRGPTEKHLIELETLGVDIMTSGNHFFDNIDKIKDYIQKPNFKLLRPANYYESEYIKFPGIGCKIIEKNNKKLLVINLISSTFLKDNVYNPFLKIDEILKEFENIDFDGIIIDFHRETTSEIYTMSMFLDGKVSFIFGTHTHVQTNDELILPRGTGFLTDVGMNGPIYGVIGANFESVKKRFLTGVLKGKIEQSLDLNYIVNGVFVEIKDKKCLNIEKIKIKGKL